MDDDYISERITKTKALIELYEDAITFLVTNPTAEYRLDTGQSIQRVRRQDLEGLQTALDILYNRLCVLEARLTGSNTLIARPLS